LLNFKKTNVNRVVSKSSSETTVFVGYNNIVLHIYDCMLQIYKP